jgi:hypothetical protein
MPLPLAQAKNGDKQFWKLKFLHAANEKAQHALMRGPVFFFGGGEEGWIRGFHSPPPRFVPNVFPWGSLSFQEISQKHLTIWFPQVQLSCIWTEKVSNKGAAFVSNLQLGVEKGTSIGEECAECSEKFGDGPINMAH